MPPNSLKYKNYSGNTIYNYRLSQNDFSDSNYGEYGPPNHNRGKFIRQIEIRRDEDYFIDITNIKFEKQYFNKNADEFLNDLMLSLREDYKGFEYKQIRDMDTLLTLYESYNSISVEDYLNNNHNIHEDNKDIINNLVANQGVLVASIIIDNKFVDEVLFIPKMP